MNNRNEEKELPFVEAELYELLVPAKLVGKAVIDKNSKIVGIVRSVRVKIPPGEVRVVVKGLNIELSIPCDVIDAIGGVVQLKKNIKAEPIAINDIIDLQEEIKDEMNVLLSSYQQAK